MRAAPTLRETRTKRADETVSLTFEFAAELVPGSALTGVPTFVFPVVLTQVGAGTVSGTTVTIQVSGGVTGNDYTIVCRMNTTVADVRAIEVVLLIRDEN